MNLLKVLYWNYFMITKKNSFFNLRFFKIHTRKKKMNAAKLMVGVAILNLIILFSELTMNIFGVALL